MDPRSTPEWVGQAHLADQPPDLRRHLWSPAARSRLPAPVGFESRAVPTDHGIGLDDRQRIAKFGEQPVEDHEYEAVKAVEGKPSRCGPPQNVDLLTQDEVLCRKRRSRPEQPDKPRPDQSAKVLHLMAVSPILLLLSTSRLPLPPEFVVDHQPDDVCGRYRVACPVLKEPPSIWPEHAGVLTAVKDKARFRARACGPP